MSKPLRFTIFKMQRGGKILYRIRMPGNLMTSKIPRLENRISFYKKPRSYCMNGDDSVIGKKKLSNIPALQRRC
jgi:hypothetical protein